MQVGPNLTWALGARCAKRPKSDDSTSPLGRGPTRGRNRSGCSGPACVVHWTQRRRDLSRPLPMQRASSPVRKHLHVDARCGYTLSKMRIGLFSA